MSLTPSRFRRKPPAGKEVGHQGLKTPEVERRKAAGFAKPARALRKERETPDVRLTALRSLFFQGAAEFQTKGAAGASKYAEGGALPQGEIQGNPRLRAGLFSLHRCTLRPINRAISHADHGF